MLCANFRLQGLIERHTLFLEKCLDLLQEDLLIGPSPFLFARDTGELTKEMLCNLFAFDPFRAVHPVNGTKGSKLSEKLLGFWGVKI